MASWIEVVSAVSGNKHLIRVSEIDRVQERNPDSPSKATIYFHLPKVAFETSTSFQDISNQIGNSV